MICSFARALSRRTSIDRWNPRAAAPGCSREDVAWTRDRGNDAEGGTSECGCGGAASGEELPEEDLDGEKECRRSLSGHGFGGSGCEGGAGGTGGEAGAGVEEGAGTGAGGAGTGVAGG